MAKPKPKLIVILGPNASGKTGLSIELAKLIKPGFMGYKGAEIISADSRQIYKGLDLGTGKITEKEMSGIPHHLLNVALPKKVFTVADYQKLGNLAIRKIIDQDKLPIICGGTGLYIDSLIYNYSFPAVEPDLDLRCELEKKTTETLLKELQKKDPRRTKNIDSKNRRRLIRALEIVIKSGKPISKLNKHPSYDFLKIGIARSPEELKERIIKRLDERLSQGMVAEVKSLHDKRLPWKRMEELGLEYRYLSRYLRGKIDYEDMKTGLQKEIIRYAKRQMTWFKKDSAIHWVTNKKTAAELVKSFLRQKTN
jgi:tRNA dimethylallyltransferase